MTEQTSDFDKYCDSQYLPRATSRYEAQCRTPNARLELGITRDLELNAWAGTERGIDFIGVNAGVYVIALAASLAKWKCSFSSQNCLRSSARRLRCSFPSHLARYDQ